MRWNAILKIFSAIGKWSGRLTALLLFLFWGAFFVEHLSEWFLRAGGRFPTAWVWVQQLFHFAMLVGLGMMVKWDKLGCAVMLAGTVAFFGGIGVLEFPWIALINLVPAGCFGVYWLSEWRLRTSVVAQGFSGPQKANLTAIGVAFTAFVLLFGNEMLGNPPLMTPALAVSPAIAGSWQAKAKAWPGPAEIDILLTVSSDGAVSGKIGGATLAGARLTGNRTWLGRLLNWRTDYIIRGELSGTVGAPPPLSNGDRFTAPINLEGPELVGSIFTSGRDADGKRVSTRPLVSRLRLNKM